MRVYFLQTIRFPLFLLLLFSLASCDDNPTVVPPEYPLKDYIFSANDENMVIFSSPGSAAKGNLYSFWGVSEQSKLETLKKFSSIPASNFLDRIPGHRTPSELYIFKNMNMQEEFRGIKVPKAITPDVIFEAYREKYITKSEILSIIEKYKNQNFYYILPEMQQELTYSFTINLPTIITKKEENLVSAIDIENALNKALNNLDQYHIKTNIQQGPSSCYPATHISDAGEQTHGEQCNIVTLITKEKPYEFFPSTEDDGIIASTDYNVTEVSIDITTKDPSIYDAIEKLVLEDVFSHIYKETIHMDELAHKLSPNEQIANKARLNLTVDSFILGDFREPRYYFLYFLEQETDNPDATSQMQHQEP